VPEGVLVLQLLVEKLQFVRLALGFLFALQQRPAALLVQVLLQLLLSQTFPFAFFPFLIRLLGDVLATGLVFAENVCDLLGGLLALLGGHVGLRVWP